MATDTKGFKARFQRIQECVQAELQTLDDDLAELDLVVGDEDENAEDSELALLFGDESEENAEDFDDCREAYLDGIRHACDDVDKEIEKVLPQLLSCRTADQLVEQLLTAMEDQLGLIDQQQPGLSPEDEALVQKTAEVVAECTAGAGDPFTENDWCDRGLSVVVRSWFCAELLDKIVDRIEDQELRDDPRIQYMAAEGWRDTLIVHADL